MSVVTFAVMPFKRTTDGALVPGGAVTAANGEIAWRHAKPIAGTAGYVGAVAFSRTGDPDSGIFSEGTVLASFGEVDLGTLHG